MFHIVYRTEDLATGQFYIGKHSTVNLQDGYRGSGRWVRQALKDGVSLVTETLQVFMSEGEALEHERSLVTLDLLAEPLCMNKTTGGRGSFAHIALYGTSEDPAAKSARVSKQFAGVPKPRGESSPIWGRKRPAHAASLAGEGNPFYGRTHTAETKAAITAGRTSAQRAATAAGNTNVRGRSWWNDGVSTFLLSEDAAFARSLVPGRLSLKKATTV